MVPDGRTNSATDSEALVAMFCDGGAIAEHSFTAPRASFQVLIRLQYLRSEVGAWRGCIENATAEGRSLVEGFVWGLRGLAAVALEGGWVAYAAMCLKCGERLGHLRRARIPSAESLQLLAAWLASSDRYLRQPSNAGVVADLVARFSALPWEDIYTLTLQSQLFRALLLPT
jgi:hypothetical protein